MSFTPRGIDTATHGWYPFNPQCCVRGERRCGALGFPYPMKDPPWFNCAPKCPPLKRKLIIRAKDNVEAAYYLQRDYLPYQLENLIMPYLAYHHYLDILPNPDKNTACPCIRNRPTGGSIQWPPLPRGVCPPAQECDPCGSGPWPNPELRRFFFTDCH